MLLRKQRTTTTKLHKYVQIMLLREAEVCCCVNSALQPRGRKYAAA
jgi:hypothetical protein